MQRRLFFVLLAALAATLGHPMVGNAQPLVTGDLSLYYSFDEVDEDGLWADGSGNGLNALTVLGEGGDANEDGLDDIRLDTDDKVRGAGSVWFDTDNTLNEDYVAVCDAIGSYPEGCEIGQEKELIPTTSFTIAMWAKVENVGTDQALWQTRSQNGGFTHTQVQSNGNFRVALRGDANTDNIVAYNEPPGGNLVPFDEWFHWAFTYDKTTEDPGEFVMYFNGEEVAAGPANGNVAGTELEIMGNWDQGAFIGLVPDFARQLVGHIDELYMFTRALPPEDITKLYTLEGGGVTGDFDADGALTLLDINLLQKAVNAGTNEAAYDLNADNLVNTTDTGVWIHDLKKSWLGDANLDGEFNSGDLVSVFTVGKYETGQPANWEEGDWNADLIFDSGDFVAAFSDGGYEIGPHPAVAAVPEPSALLLTLLGLAAIVARRRAR